MKKSRFKITVKVVSVICLISILLTSCTMGIVTRKLRFDALEYIGAQYSSDSLHRSEESVFTSICTSGLIELLFDKTTTAVAIREQNSQKLWTSLPCENLTKSVQSSAVEVVLSNGENKIYTLNSQDNSVNFGNFSYAFGVDGVSVTYAISLDKETGAKEISSLSDKDIRVDLTVLYKLSDGSFYANVSMNNVILPEGVCLEKITLLNDFGAYEQSGSEDYIFVPDGSGALIMTGKEDNQFSPVLLSVYGEDASITKSTNTSDCLIGAYGIKKDDAAFLCIIEDGDAIAQINATRNSADSLNSVNASFNITDIYTEQTGKKVTRFLGNQYKNEITLCYRFLSGKSATYSGMATACRENLIRNHILSSKSVDTSNKHLPLVVSLQGGYINEKGKYHELSNYEQALSLMTLLKAKGVNNIYLRYNGIYENANNGNAKEFDKFKSSLGNEKEYKALYDYLNSQKFSLFIDTDILTCGENQPAALDIDKAKIRDNNSYSFPAANEKQSFLKMNKFENRINDILTDSENMIFDGYALNDMGSYLYSDYSDPFYSRTLAQKEISAQLPVLAASKMLMIDNGNFYAIRNADVISKIPLSPLTRTENSAYVGIPFVQMLIHGISEYSAAGFNTADDPQVAFLKSVEYGCLPGADWYCTLFTENLDKQYFYDNNINDIVKYYTKANSALADLRDARMTSHNMIEQGVYCTEYDNSIKVYVNYTDKSVTINGIIVNPMDCVTIS